MATPSKEDIEILKNRGVEYNALNRMTDDLCKALPINDLLPSMISNHVIEFQDKAEICAERTERSRVQKLIDDYLIRDLEVWDTKRFYRFLTVMERSPKCNFLVKRLKHWMEQYKEYSAKPGENVPFVQVSSSPSTSSCTTKTAPGPTAPINTSPTAPANTGPTAPPATTPLTSGNIPKMLGYMQKPPGNVNISCDDSLVTGKDSGRCMRLMRQYVVPRISEEWEAVAAFLDYSIQEKNDIKKAHKSPRECCKILLEDWVTTSNGVKPKTWRKLFEVLSEIDELKPVVGDIKQDLQSEGVIFDVFPVEDSHDYNSQSEEDEEETIQASRAAYNIQYQPQAPYYQTDPYTEDPTRGRGWNQQPQSSIGIDEQFGLYRHPSYDMPSTAVNQYERLMATNPPPAAHNRQHYAAGMDQHARQVTTNRISEQHHGFSAFIMYSKEEYDPHGEQVLCLSNLLNNCGINCDIDLYHLNENIMDWAFWAGKRVEYYSTSVYSYVILVCSPTMIATLEERNDNARVHMAAGYIDRLSLRHHLQEGVQRVLPLSINKSSADYVPPILSGKTWYHFPYDTLAEMPVDIPAEQVLNHPSFTSLRSLVATLTGQPEHVPPGRSQPQVQRRNILRHDYNQPPSTLDQDSPFDKATAPYSYAPGTGEQSLPPDEQLHHSHHSLPPGAADQSGQLRSQPQRSSVRNSPKIMRRDPPSGADQNVHITAPQSVTPRTAEQAQLYDEQLHRPLLPAAANYHSSQLRTQAHGPAARNNPNILRRNPGLPPSVVDQDVPFDNTTATSIQSSVATVLAEEEAGGTKRPRDYSSSDNDSYYSTPNESPRDGSLVTMSASHHPTQVTPSMNTMPPAEATACTDQNNSSYYPAFPVQK